MKRFYFPGILFTCLSVLSALHLSAQTQKNNGLLAASLDGRLRLSPGTPLVFDLQAQAGRFVAENLALGFGLQIARPQTITRIERNVTESGQGVFARYYIPHKARPSVRVFIPVDVMMFQRRGQYYDIQGNTISSTPIRANTRRQHFSTGLGLAWFLSDTWALESRLLYMVEGFRRSGSAEYQYASLITLRMGVQAFIRSGSHSAR